MSAVNSETFGPAGASTQVPPTRRVVGIETEYGLHPVAADGGPCPYTPDEAAQELFRPFVEAGRATNSYLPNGSRMYLDVGSHPEYATAECDRLTDLIANDRAGDLLIAELATNAEARLAASPRGAARLHLFKNNVDSAGNSFGCHENYLVRRRRDYRARIDALVPFFTTRQVLCGAGIIFDGVEHAATEGEHRVAAQGGYAQAGAAHAQAVTGHATFEISQRAHHMWDAVSSASTRSRPMINTRDEPHGDADLYRRMHVIVGDSTMSDTSTALKVGMTYLLLNAVECGVRPPDLTLENPMHAIRAVSADTSLTATIATSRGQLTALDIQHIYLETALSALDRGDYSADPALQWVIATWPTLLDRLRAGDHDAGIGIIDWMTKRHLLERYQAKLGVTGFDDPRIRRLDLAFHDVTRGGLRPSLEKAGVMKRLVDEQTAEAACHIPPQTTRAKLRGDFVAAALDARKDFAVEWAAVRIIDVERTRTVLLKDPFATTHPDVESIIENFDDDPAPFI